MKWGYQFYRLFNLLSLDIAVGAGCMSAFVCIILNLEVPGIYYILLAQTVWAVYLLDHFYDSKKKISSTNRRKFYIKHTRLLLYLLLLNGGILIIFFILNFNLDILKSSLPAALITVLYLIANWRYQAIRKPFYLKEVLIALGYTAGLLVIPFSVQTIYTVQIFVIGTMVGCIALWNVLIIASFEKRQNEVEGQTTISQWMSLKQIRYASILTIVIFLSLTCLLTVFYFIFWGQCIVWVFIGIYMTIPVILPNYFKINERYSKWAEQVFLIPGIYFLALM